MPEIEIKGLSFGYSDSASGTETLENIDLHIADGEFICLLGASGCGKSTLLRLMAGLESPTAGQLLIGGRAVEGTGADRMIVFQDYALFPWLTALKNVRFAVKEAKKLPKAEAQRIAEDMLGRVGMQDAMDKYPFQLSGGMRQRVAIARALAMDTDILLLDEPFGALDAGTRASLQELLLELWQNKGGKKKTVVFVTHDISEAVLLADRVVYMQPGRIAAEIKVELPRPRSRENTAELRDRLRSLFELPAEEEDR